MNLTTANPPNWFMAAMTAGIKSLLALSLQRTPAASLLGVTTATWAKALWPGRAWDPADEPRIIEGFRRLAATCEYWPAPIALIREIPAKKEPPQPRMIESDERREQNRRKVDAIAKKLTASVLATGGK